MEELAELAKKAAGHDADAFTALMQSQMQNMYKTARAILSNESDIGGSWSFDLTLSGSPNTTTYDLDAELGDSGATVIQAVLSPLSATIYYEFPYSEYTIEAEDEDGLTRIATLFDEAPAFIGFRMKDGTDIRYLTGGGSNGYDNDMNDIENGEKYIYRVIQGYGRVIDVNEIESLLFVKSWPEESEDGEAILSDENLYIVTLE
ncbi:MAG: hypothetical protein LUG99_17665 [Lachnospiraceae bacterium]|nr:hypothetical protein [Lachnospiraceae bacterium]